MFFIKARIEKWGADRVEAANHYAASEDTLFLCEECEEWKPKGRIRGHQTKESMAHGLCKRCHEGENDE